MSTALTSGVYHEPLISRALHQFAAGLFGSLAQRAAAVPYRTRARAQEAADVRALARSVEHQSPGFAADLYAAAARHEGQD